jgi:hypothetical protein
MSSIPSVWRNFEGSPAAVETGSGVETRARRFFVLNVMLGLAVLIAAAVTVAAWVRSTWFRARGPLTSACLGCTSAARA